METTFTPDRLIAGGPLKTGSATILEGQDLKRGAVLGRVTRALGDVVADGDNTGNGTLEGLALGSGAVLGNYRLVCSRIAAAGPPAVLAAFEVYAPDGSRLADAVATEAYANAHLAFTVTPGATPFALGDEFTVPVQAGSLKAKAVDSDAIDGSQSAHSVLAADIDATEGDVAGAVVYLAGEFNVNALSFGGDDVASDHEDALRALGIFIREPVSDVG